MTIEHRVKLYRQLESLRGRPVITYITSPRQGAQGNIASDSVNELMYQLDALPSSAKELDFVLVSNGGDPTVAWRLVSLIRERVKKFTVLVPQAAYSAATLVALGADEILMHPHGNLGPTDPQISQRRAKDPNAPTTGFGSEDLSAFLKFAREEVKLTDQDGLVKVFNAFCEEVGAVAIGVAARSAQLSVNMGEKLLKLHMRADGDNAKARTISEKLTRDFFHHGYPVSRTEAKQIGLPIAENNAPVEKIIWDIWLDVTEDLCLRSVAADTEFILNNPACAPLFGPVPHIFAPMAEKHGNATAIPNQVIMAPPAPFTRTFAIMESDRIASRFVINGQLFGARMPDLNLRLSKVVEYQGWENVTVPVLNTGTKRGIDNTAKKRVKKASVAANAHRRDKE